nr:NusA N-terminal domain-containing protein [Alphaproteobacteria bacterium]
MELLSITQAVAQEKNLDYDIVLNNALAALEKAARNHYGRENDIRISIDRKTQEMKIARYREVVADDAEIENEYYQIHLKDALREDKNAKVGEFMIDDLPMITFSRADAQTVKQSFNQGIREADREKQFEEFKDREGEVVYGTV